MLSNEQSMAFIKVFGPVLLFVATPVVTWICIDLTLKQVEMGRELTVGTSAFMILFVAACAGGGFYGCRMAYGWFQKK